LERQRRGRNAKEKKILTIYCQEARKREGYDREGRRDTNQKTDKERQRDRDNGKER
jgi:hypothetical protein